MPRHAAFKLILSLLVGGVFLYLAFRDVPLGRGTHLVLVTRGHKYDYEALRDVLLRDAQLAGHRALGDGCPAGSRPHL